MKLKPAGYALREISLQVIYVKGNPGFHLGPVSDAVRVYLPFIKSQVIHKKLVFARACPQ